MKVHRDTGCDRSLAVFALRWLMPKPSAWSSPEIGRSAGLRRNVLQAVDAEVVHLVWWSRAGPAPESPRSLSPDR
jgi:hypothetical protein